MSSQTLYLHSARPNLRPRPRPSRRNPRASPFVQPPPPLPLRLSLSAVARSPPRNSAPRPVLQHLRRRLAAPTVTDALVLVAALALLCGLARTLAILLPPPVYAHQPTYRINASHVGSAKLNHRLAAHPVVHHPGPAPDHFHRFAQNTTAESHRQYRRHARHAKRNLTRRSFRPPAHRVSNPPALPELDLSRIPHPRWWHDAHLSKFVPARSLRTDVRLVMLEHALFCTVRNRFLLPSERRKLGRHRFPGFMKRHAIAQVVQWRPAGLKATHKQRVMHIKGTTVLWRGRGINVRHRHLLRSLVPIRAVLDELGKTKNEKDVKIAAEAFESGNSVDKGVRKLHDYFFGDVPVRSRVALRDYHPSLLYFDRVISLGSEYEARVSSSSSFDKVKSLIESVEARRLSEPLVRSCTSSSANRRTIWVLDRQQMHRDGGSISNMAGVVTSVNHALLRAGLADSIELRTVQSPDMPCPPGTGREGCFATDCGSEHRGCDRASEMVRHVQAFNNMTVLVSLAGPALDDVVYMPRGAAVVEVLPYGVRGEDGYREVAKAAGVRLYQMRNRKDKEFERTMHERFGDVAQTEKSCWADPECLSARESVPTKIDVHHLKLLLGVVFREWRKRCVV